MSVLDESIQQAVKIYKALGEPTRLQIVQMLAQQGALSCTEIGEQMKHLAFSTLSHHLKQLRECGVLQATHQGTYRLYRCRPEILKLYAPHLLK